MTVDLAECRAKIERAREHTNGLDAVIKPVLRGDAPAADLVQISAKLDPQSGDHVFRVAAIPRGWQLRVGVILGDIVHNLRSALDYLFYALCRRHLGISKTEKLGNQVQFPIEDNRQTLTNKRVHFAKIPACQWAVIEDAQPYKGTDPPRKAIRAIRELSNRDKHRALNPLLLRTTKIEFHDSTLAARATTDFVFPNDRRYALGGNYLEIGTEIVRVGLRSEVDAEIEMAGHITPRIQLPEIDIPMMFGVGLMVRAVINVADGIQPGL